MGNHLKPKRKALPLHPHKLTVPHIHAAIAEDVQQRLAQGVFCDALFEDDLQEATAARAADHAAGEQVAARGEDLLDAGVGAVGVKAFGTGPLLIQKGGEGVDFAQLQLEFHQGCDAADAAQGVHSFGRAVQIAAHDLPEEIAGEAALAGVDQREAALQFTGSFRGEGEGFHAKFLARAGGGRGVFDAGGHAAHLILPAAAGAHDLLDAQHAVVLLPQFGGDAEDVVQSADARARQNAAGSKAAAARDVQHLRG